MCKTMGWPPRTVHVPGKGIPQLLPVDLHVQSDGNQHLGLGRVLMDHSWVVVVEAGREAAACSARGAGVPAPRASLSAPLVTVT